MSKRNVLTGGLLAIAAALPLLAVPGSADARVVVGVGFGFPVFGFGAPYYYPPPPVYYAPPPVVYAPPPVAYGAPAVARCIATNVVCPLRFPRPVGAPCGCPDAYGRGVSGRVG